MANNYEALNQSRKELVEQITELMQKEGLNWTAGWSSIARPYNPVSDVKYRGGNVLRLLVASQINKYTDPRWLTYKQAQEKGWQVKKGSRGVKLEKWIFEKEETVKDSITGEEKKIKVSLDKPIPYYFTVFNASQIDGIPELVKMPLHKNETYEITETFIASSECPVKESPDGRNYYSPGEDAIYLTPADSFITNDARLATALHEMAHSTGHSSRLNRQMDYAQEELVAEIATVFVKQNYGIEVDADLENHAAYLKSWIKALNDDPNELFRAAAAADKASDRLVENYEKYIIENTPVIEEPEEEVEKLLNPDEISTVAQAEQLINLAEEKRTIFTAEERDFIVNHAYKLDDIVATKQLIADLASASGENKWLLIQAAQEEIDYLPDGMVGLSEMHQYGYTSGKLLPLTKERAVELFEKEDLPVYKLCEENTEALIEDLSEFEGHEGLFGIEEDTWNKYITYSEPEIEFFVAECMEYHNMGNMYEHIPTAELALKIYAELPEDIRSMVPGIGVIADGLEYQLLPNTDLDIYPESFRNNEVIKDAMKLFEKYEQQQQMVREGLFEVSRTDSTPVVTIKSSGSVNLYKGQKMTLAEADALFAHLDEKQIIQREQPGKGSVYERVSFKVDFILNDELQTLEGMQELGNGDGSLINHIRLATERVKNDNTVLAFIQEHKGAEVLESQKSAWDKILNEDVPYLKMHCSISGIEQNAIEALTLVNTQPEKEYYEAVLSYVNESRLQLNTGNISKMPQMPDWESFINEKVIAQHIKDAGYRPTKKLASCIDAISRCTGKLSITAKDLKEAVKKILIM